MPIPNDFKEMYPDNWEELREKVLDRCEVDGVECCEWCGRPNGVKVYVEDDGSWWLPRNKHSDEVTKTVLTVAHLCQTPTCDNLDHLRALCQRCHLQYDQKGVRWRIET